MSMSLVLGTARHFLIKHGPTLLTVAGAAMCTASTVTAVKASLDYKEEVSEPVLTTLADVEASSAPEDEKIALRRKLKIALVAATIRRYAIPAALGIGGLACIGYAHWATLGRLGATASALAAAQAHASGLQVDNILDANVIEKALDGATVDEAAKAKAAAAVANMRSLKDSNPDVVWFDESNPNWSSTPEYARTFLRAQETYLNQRLFARGYLFLNEVYAALGIQETRVGAVMGWDTKKDPNTMVTFDWYSGETAIGEGDDAKTVWKLYIQPPHNLVA